MIAQRIFSSGYSRSGVWIFLAITVAYFGSVASGQAQVDPNIQTQANILSPPVITVPLVPTAPAGPVSKATAQFLKNIKFPEGPCQPTDAQIKDAIAKVASNVKAASKAAKFNFLAASSLLSDDELEKVKQLLVYPPNFQYCHGQPIVVKASLLFNPTFETNALKNSLNNSPDKSFDVGGGVLVTAGVGDKRPYDLMFLNVQSASARYATNSSKSLDTLTAQAGYQYLIDAYYYDGGKPVYVDQNHIPRLNETAATTFDTLSFGVLNQTTFTPTFRQQTANLFTPQVTLARQNFDLADPNAKLCSSGSGFNFCYYMDLSLTMGQTFSDVSTLQNANAAISATVGTRFSTNWTLAGQAVATSRSYENVPGGRQDFLLQAGPVLTYAPAATATPFGKASITFSLPVNYYQNYSTISKDAWRGVIIQPTLTIAFLPNMVVK
jgi:hypothetical protein